ncbi:MAG: hypothetical protein V7641_2947 [Blastocatellia bacterium]
MAASASSQKRDRQLILEVAYKGLRLTVEA